MFVNIRHSIWEIHYSHGVSFGLYSAPMMFPQKIQQISDRIDGTKICMDRNTELEGASYAMESSPWHSQAIFNKELLLSLLRPTSTSHSTVPETPRAPYNMQQVKKGETSNALPM